MAEVSWNHNQTKVLTIASGQQVSDYLNLLSKSQHGLWGIGIATNEVAFEGTVNIYVYTIDFTETPVLLQSNGVDIVVVANRALVLQPFPFIGIEIRSTVNQSEDRTFRVIGMVR